MAQLSTDDLQELKGQNTIEGDSGNDTTAQGGIGKAAVKGTAKRKKG